MAKTDSFNPCVALHKAGEHGHGVGVIEEPRVGAYLLHVLRKIAKHRYGAQSAEDTAYSAGVRNSLAQTVFFRYFKIGYRAGVIKSDLNGVHNKIRAAQSILAVLNTEKFSDFCTVFVDVPVESRNHYVGLIKPLGVYVVECYFAFAQSLGQHYITEHVFGEHGASCAHKCYLHKFFLRL